MKSVGIGGLKVMSDISAHPRDDRPEPLSVTQMRALTWIDQFSCQQAEWRSGDKPARGGPENWDRMKLSAKDGSITIMVDDWRALRGLFEGAEFGSGRLYQVSEKGRAILADAHSNPPVSP